MSRNHVLEPRWARKSSEWPVASFSRDVMCGALKSASRSICCSLILLFVCLTASGCSYWRNIPNLRPAGYWLPSSRLSRGSQNSPREIVERTDWIELRGKSGKPIQVTIKDPDNCDGSPGAWTNGGKLANVARPRIPVALLAHSQSLNVTEEGSATKTIALCKRDRPIIDLRHHLRWKTVARLFDRAGFKPTLVKSIPEHALPGNEMLITAFWQSRSGDVDTGTRAYSFSQMRATVGRDGRVFVPLLSAPATGDQSQAPDRKWSAVDNNELSYIRVWEPGVPYGRQPVLQDIEACIAEAAHTPPSRGSTAGARSCYGAWIDGRVFAAEGRNVARVRYHFEPIQYWTLVFDDGSHVKYRYIPGETVIGAISQAYLGHYGRVLEENSGIPFTNRYVIVLPSLKLGGKAAIPFWAELDHNGMTELRHIRILPDDVVQLTCTPPRGS